MLWYLSTTIAMALAGIVVYLYYHHKGQFDEDEEAKYLVFRDDEPQKTEKPGVRSQEPE